MKVLGVDTSSPCASLGIIDDGDVLAETTICLPDTHSARLIPSIEALLKDARVDLAQLDGMAVSIGPGSFTGLRVGLSTIKGLALATRTPVVGVPTLDALAQNLCFARQIICAMIDARKGEMFVALYRGVGNQGITRLTPYLAVSPERLPEVIPQEETIFVGNGTGIWQNIIRERLGGRALFSPGYLSVVRGAVVAELGRRRMLAGEADELASLVPIYVRPSDAELNWSKGSQPLLGAREV